MAGALPPAAGNGHQLSFIQPKLALLLPEDGSQYQTTKLSFSMSYYTTTSGQETLRDQPIFFFSYKAAVITSTPARPSLFFPLWDQNTKGISYLLCWIGARNRNFSRPPTSLLPPPFFLFANDVEIWNHFVFSVIMNIWCMPSGHVVVWWAWPWLLVKKKKKKET